MKLNMIVLPLLVIGLVACSEEFEFSPAQEDIAESADNSTGSDDAVGTTQPEGTEPEVVEEEVVEEEVEETPEEEVVVEDPNALPTQADILQLPAFTLRINSNAAIEADGLRYTKFINETIEPTSLVMPDTLTLMLGQTLNVCNDGQENIRIHTGGRPFPHGANIAPGACTEYTIAGDTGPTNNSVYDHNLGRNSNNYFRMNIVDQAGADAIIAAAAQ
ncbi:MAG: hypothetical protein HRU19_24925 [Pseudobacteriovorax sp.]|nr:hypothetical protein [Pseudobacteriovorax sp.]